MKKGIALILTAVLLLTGCGSTSAQAGTQENTDAAQEEAEQRMHRAIYSETDENAVTNDLTNIPAGITQFILVTAGDFYKARENKQEKAYSTYFEHLLDPWIKYDC